MQSLVKLESVILATASYFEHTAPLTYSFWLERTLVTILKALLQVSTLFLLQLVSHFCFSWVKQLFPPSWLAYSLAFENHHIIYTYTYLVNSEVNSKLVLFLINIKKNKKSVCMIEKKSKQK